MEDLWLIDRLESWLDLRRLERWIVVGGGIGPVFKGVKIIGVI